MRKNLSDLRLLKGSHESPEHGGCMMEVVSWWAGESHSDHPDCVDPVIASLCRALNDRLPGDERQGLIDLIPVVTGTNDGRWCGRAYLCADRAVRVFAVDALRKAGRDDDADTLAALDPVVDAETAYAAAHAAHAADAVVCAASHAASAASHAASAASHAADYAAYAASHAAYAAADAAYAAYAADPVRQLILDCCAIGAEARAPASLPAFVDLPAGAERSPTCT